MTTTTTRAAGVDEASRPSSPEAFLVHRPTWKDPRLWVGIMLVAGCVLLGGRLFASADDTVTVWSAARDLPAGTTLTADVLAPTELRFESAGTAGRYLATRHRLPEAAVLAHDVSAGELLPRDALTEAVGEELVEVPVAVAADAVPAGLRAGQVVDVWVAPARGDGKGAAEAVKVLSDVSVAAVPRQSGALGPAVTRQVLLGVPGDAEEVLADALARLAAGEPVLVRRG